MNRGDKLVVMVNWFFFGVAFILFMNQFWVSGLALFAMKPECIWYIANMVFMFWLMSKIYLDIKMNRLYAIERE